MLKLVTSWTQTLGDATIFLKKFQLFLLTKCWKNTQKLLKKTQIHYLLLTAWATQMAQTREIMFQNVAYTPTVYKTEVPGKKRPNSASRTGMAELRMPSVPLPPTPLPIPTPTPLPFVADPERGKGGGWSRLCPPLYFWHPLEHCALWRTSRLQSQTKTINCTMFKTLIHSWPWEKARVEFVHLKLVCFAYSLHIQFRFSKKATSN